MPKPRRRAKDAALRAKGGRGHPPLSHRGGPPTLSLEEYAATVRREVARDRCLASLDVMACIALAVGEGDLLAWASVCRATRAGVRASGRALRSPESAVCSSGSIARIRWAVSMGLHRSLVVPRLASLGHTELMLRAREELGLPWRGGWACSLAAENGRLQTLRILHESGAPWDLRAARGLATAAPKGAVCHPAHQASEQERLCMLKWARAAGAPCGHEVFSRAAESGFKEIHTWARAVGIEPVICEECDEYEFCCFECAGWNCVECDAAVVCGDPDQLVGCGEAWCPSHAPFRPCRNCGTGLCSACVAKHESPDVTCDAPGCTALFCGGCADDLLETCEKCGKRWCMEECAADVRGFYCEGCGTALCRQCIDEAADADGGGGVALLILTYGH